MPELPEVETVRKGLENIVIGKTILAIDIRWQRLIETNQALDQWVDQLLGQTITRVDRRGKYLIFQLTHGALISHLRMEGKYHYQQSLTTDLDKHTHVIFYFSDGSCLMYHDVRKFGRFAYRDDSELGAYFQAKRLGVEPLSQEFNPQEFYQALQTRPTAIKPLLLSQRIVVGLGNIYVDEALFLAKIHPSRPANQLSPKEVEMLYEKIVDVLSQAVEAGGSTIRTYKNTLGELGKFQQALNVYGQQGQPCPKCHTLIEKIKIAQRGTHICPNCQK